ncbi:MAG: M4 family metallopeptidase [Flavobacteriales bacterium]|nr:M4 family metallopeptidase [Flavobacteriales bacterium]
MNWKMGLKTLQIMFGTGLFLCAFTVKAQVQWQEFQDMVQMQIALSKQQAELRPVEQFDVNEVTHTRQIQQVGGIDIEGAHILTHTRKDGSVRLNGLFVKNISPQQAKLNFPEALASAMSHLDEVVFFWEDPAMEELIRDLRNSDDATFYPKEQLVYFDPQYRTEGRHYKLAYKIELYYHGPGEHRTYFVDANSGEILDIQEGCMESHALGKAETSYSGTRTIHTDSIAPDQFELFDRLRGKGIETRNARNLTKTDSSITFQDTDNYWENDRAATNAHWASGITYDYFLNFHGRKSFDGKDSKILSYIHYDKNWFNASWNGSFARYGDGNGFPLTHIDVVAHELTHGVTGTSSKLIYRDESGALNESFSDIFGSAVEHYALRDTADWLIGTANFKLRSMAQPNLFRHPDTYKGTDWYSGIQDRGGVHTNSGVQNYWFYLLCTGGSGRNDLGIDFNVDSLGIEKATQIAYHNLVYYLTPSSGYFDARNGSIQAAIDLYGLCSPEVYAVAQAWHAVGVGSPVPEPDFAMLELLSPVSSCEMAIEPITVRWMFAGSGCDSLLPRGSSVVFNTLLNDTVLITESLVLQKDLHPYDTLIYTFQNRPDFSERAIYNLSVWLNASGDGIHSNDSISDIVIVHPRLFQPGISIGFESSKRSEELPYFYLENRLNSTAEISIPARNTGVFGVQLSGKLGNSLNELKNEMPVDPNDNFSTNTDYIAKMCLCVDARDWASPAIRFDLKQTYSSGYERFLDTVRPEILSSLRLTAAAQQVGEQFHPKTISEDSFRTYVSDLAAFAGTKFSLCFESKHFVGRLTLNNDAIGDNSYLDNIEIFSGSSLSESFEEPVLFHPNPSSGHLGFRRYVEEDRVLKISVSDLYDREVVRDEITLRHGFHEYRMNWSWLRPGIYLVRTDLEGVSGFQRLLIH